MGMDIKLPELSKAELTPAVVGLLEMAQELAQRVHLQEEEIGRLKDEIAVLKKQKRRPKIKPSKMDDDTGGVVPTTRGHRDLEHLRGKTRRRKILRFIIAKALRSKVSIRIGPSKAMKNM
jgi:hypothetical protein